MSENEFGPCELCNEKIPGEITQCPHCGFNPKKNMLRIGTIITVLFSLVGIVVPVLWTIAASGVVLIVLTLVISITPTNPTT